MWNIPFLYLDWTRRLAWSNEEFLLSSPFLPELSILRNFVVLFYPYLRMHKIEHSKLFWNILNYSYIVINIQFT
jgi:hypothetical protein